MLLLQYPSSSCLSLQSPPTCSSGVFRTSVSRSGIPGHAASGAGESSRDRSEKSSCLRPLPPSSPQSLTLPSTHRPRSTKRMALNHHMPAGYYCPPPTSHVYCAVLFSILMLIWQRKFQFKDPSYVRAPLYLCDTKRIPDYICFPPYLTSPTRYATK